MEKMKKHYYFVSAKFVFAPSVFKVPDVELIFSDSFELIQKNQSNKEFFLSVAKELKTRLEKSFLKALNDPEINEMSLISISRLG